MQGTDIDSLTLEYVTWSPMIIFCIYKFLCTIYEIKLSSYATNETILVHLQLIHMLSYSDRRRSGRRSSSLHCRYKNSALISIYYGVLYSSQSIPWLSSAGDCYLIWFRGPNYLQTTDGTDQSAAVLLCLCLSGKRSRTLSAILGW